MILTDIVILVDCWRCCSLTLICDCAVIRYAQATNVLTLTRSKINIEVVYLCMRAKDFAPISTISDYIHWAALMVWFVVFFITSYIYMYCKLQKVRQVVERVWFDWCDFIGIQITAIKSIHKYIPNKFKSSKINIEVVYLCMRAKDFAPISTISDYIHWAALMVWFVVFFITSMISGMFEDLLHTYFIENTNTLSKRFVVQHHKLIINKHKFEVQQLLLCKKQYYLWHVFAKTADFWNPNQEGIVF
jgi:hypothetical protein